MTTEPVPLVAGALLFALAGGSSAVTMRRLAADATSGDGRQRGAVRTLLWLLVTTALAVGAAAVWAGPGLDLGSTWPFAVALVLALAPLVVAAVRRRRRAAHPSSPGAPADG